MRPVFIAGTGLACALGGDLPDCIAALRQGGVRPVAVTAAEGFDWPVFQLPRAEGDWATQARAHVRRVAAESGAMATSRTAPLFVASSSLDIGEREQDASFPVDLQDFADVVAAWIGWRGPVYTVSTACTSSVNALLAAADLIRHGEAANALVLGIELPNRYTLAGFGAMQLLSPDAAQPFGAARNGLLLGEAVAALWLTSEAARWRLRGGANVVDGRNPAGTEAGAVDAMCNQALTQAGLAPRDIDLLKPQAAGSMTNDAIELDALRTVFGDALPPMVSFKAQMGHTLGAAGAAEIALLAGCIEARAWPALGYALDPACGVVLNARAPARLRHILVNTIGFGGGHTALVLEDCSA
jgi:3-oxoacyl-[acyl-carrier-protein] synthase-1